MAEGKKRAAVKARKAHVQVAKGTRRRQRTGSGSHRAESLAYGSRTFTRTQNPGQGLSITVQIPPLRRPRQSQSNTSNASNKSLRQRILQPILVAPILLIAAAIAVIGMPGDNAEQAPATAVSATERTAPDYQPLVPSAETASATRYDAKRNLVSYTTNFSGARVTVSQQRIPANFKNDKEALNKMADSIHAKRRIDTGRGPLFITTPEAAEDEMAIFAEKDVLLFIHTDRKLDDTSWKSFIELLQAKSWSELI